MTETSTQTITLDQAEALIFAAETHYDHFRGDTGLWDRDLMDRIVMLQDDVDTARASGAATVALNGDTINLYDRFQDSIPE